MYICAAGTTLKARQSDNEQAISKQAVKEIKEVKKS